MGSRRMGVGDEAIRAADRRVGILGGTFDPVHYGHLLIAEEIAETLELDRVYFVPAATPPHKLGATISTAEDRAAMLELAIAGNDRFALCRIELGRKGPSYTVDTLEKLTDEAHSQEVERDFYLIVSCEAADDLPTWRAPARILELARLVMVPRPGFVMPDPDALACTVGAPPGAGRILVVDTLPLAHSASDIRRRAAAGRTIRYLVPPAVEAYICDHRLYRSASPSKAGPKEDSK
jgi:nicotinate-nucleotide adenylyltransferase